MVDIYIYIYIGNWLHLLYFMLHLLKYMELTLMTLLYLVKYLIYCLILLICMLLGGGFNCVLDNVLFTGQPK